MNEFITMSQINYLKKLLHDLKLSLMEDVKIYEINFEDAKLLIKILKKIQMPGYIEHATMEENELLRRYTRALTEDEREKIKASLVKTPSELVKSLGFFDIDVPSQEMPAELVERLELLSNLLWLVEQDNWTYFIRR